MEGYRNNDEATKEVFMYVNGKKFFRTGDLGRIVDDKFLKITGRIKELYKLENGKYVTPVPLEDGICRSQFVAQALVYGSDKKFNTALIVPDFVQLNGWAVKNRVVIGDLSTVDGRVNLMNHDKIINLLNAELVAVCGPMKHYERIRRWTPISEAFSQENNLLTPKMSLRRNQIVKQYEDVIDDMYTLNSTSHEIFH
ncbi:unnamed protein product [Symbiodinium microadriaticum]|nr:unnamed protein product [Symbiodinium microadriaticum]